LAFLPAQDADEENKYAVENGDFKSSAIFEESEQSFDRLLVRGKSLPT
jgi:hypothetical protein